MAGRTGRILSRAAVAAVFLLMAIGNVVSATGSGLACPDWPLCHGRLIPALEPDVLIEYSHRLIAAVASVLLVAAIAAAIRSSAARGVRRVGIWLLVLLGVQIGLGGVTVLFGLPRLVSTAHLVNALLILGGLLVLAAPPSPVGAAIAGRIDRLVRIGLPVLLLQLALGGYVRHAGAGLACPDFPLCSGAILPGHWLAAAHWVHRWLGVALLGWALHLAIRARGGALARPAILVAALAVLQVGLGIAAVVLRLAPPVRAFHAVVGYALWAMLVWIGARGGCWSGLLGTTPAPRADAPAAEVVHVA